MADERTNRDAETRDKESRTQGWTPPSTLPDPIKRDGWTYRWIRASTLGQVDNMNVSVRFREGWVPVQASEVPEIQIESDHTSRFAAKGNIEVGGLLLCKAPEKMMLQRQAHFEKAANDQLASVDAAVLQGSDARMPMSRPERRSTVSFGGPSRKG